MAEPDRTERLAVAGAWAVVVALVAWSAWDRWEVLASTPYPTGIDGYYYPIQLRALLERGALAYPAAPLTFWLMAPVAALTDPITAAKLVAALGGALAIVPAWLLGRRVGGRMGGLAAAVLVATSGGSFYLSLEFVKNGVGLTLALTAVWLAARALERPGTGRIALAVAGVLAAALAHKMAAMMAVVLVAPAAWLALRARWVPGRTARVLAIAGAALAALVVVAGLLAPERFLAARDLELLDHVLVADAEWGLPAMAVPRRDGSVYRLWLGHQGLVVLAAIVGFGLGAAIALASRARRATLATLATDDAIAWAALGLAALAALPWLAVDQAEGLGFRLRVASFAPASIVVAAAVGRGTARLPPAVRAAVIAPLLIVWTLALPARSTEGMVRAHPAMVAAMQGLRGRLPPDAVVITSERHLGFMAAWYARVPVRLRPEPVPAARRWRMMPLAAIGNGSPLDQRLRAARGEAGIAPPIGLHPGHPNGLVLVPEATWEWVLAGLPPAQAAWWRAWHTI